MILDIDFLIDFFNKNSFSGTKDEMGEQEDTAPHPQVEVRFQNGLTHIPSLEVKQIC